MVAFYLLASSGNLGAGESRGRNPGLVDRITRHGVWWGLRYGMRTDWLGLDLIKQKGMSGGM
jgi:hypothetical protein